MGVSTLRPSGTTINSGTVVGAASAHAALSDNSDSSYLSFNANNQQWNGALGDIALPAGAVVKTVAVRVRVARPTAASPSPSVSAGLTLGDGRQFPSMGTIVTWAAPTTITLVPGTGMPTGISDAALDGATASVKFFGLASSPLRAYELYIDVTYVEQAEITADAPTGAVTDTTLPVVVWTPAIDAPSFTVQNDGRSEGDCMRIATALAWGQQLGFGYADTPSTPRPAGSRGDEQLREYDNWAAVRGLRWWRSYEGAPTRGRWLALVDSPGGYASHVVVMDGRRLVADPANYYTPQNFRRHEIRGAFVLKRAADPWWTTPQELWRLPHGYRDDWRETSRAR